MFNQSEAGERIVVHAPAGAQLAIELAAMKAQLPPSQFLRRLLLDGLEANGFALPGAEDWPMR